MRTYGQQKERGGGGRKMFGVLFRYRERNAFRWANEGLELGGTHAVHVHYERATYERGTNRGNGKKKRTVKYANEGGGGEATAFLHLHPVTAVGGGGRRGREVKRRLHVTVRRPRKKRSFGRREGCRREEGWKKTKEGIGGWKKISERHLATSF